MDVDVASKLKKAKVKSVADLWATIGPNFKEGIQRVAETTRIEEQQLREILKQQALAYSTPSVKFWSRFFFQVGRHWGEVLAVIVIGILLSLLILSAIRRQDTVVVSASNGLPAFHIIGPGDVRREKMFTVHDSFTSESEVLGRYLLQPVSPKAVLLKSQVAGAELKEQLRERQIVTLPVKSGVISSTLAPASRVRLLFSPRNTNDPKTSTTPTLSQPIANFIIDDVIVLSVNRHGDSASITIAFKNEEDLIRALPLLNTSDILITE
jgi:hypothetical protein